MKEKVYYNSCKNLATNLVNGCTYLCVLRGVSTFSRPGGNLKSQAKLPPFFPSFILNVLDECLKYGMTFTERKIRLYYDMIYAGTLFKSSE